MYVVSSSLPPLLPTVFVVSVGICSSRLRERGIVCSDPNRILMAGKVRVACFDKTGTLTKQGLDFLGVHPIIEGNASSQSRFEEQVSVVDKYDAMSKAMASCQSLSLAGEMLIGNSVDIKMFEAAGWTLRPGQGVQHDEVVRRDGAKLKLVKRFDFDHHRMTMSAVALDTSSNTYHVFVKGSAEKIKTLCHSFAIPANFDTTAETHARSGCYVIAMGSRVATSAEVDAIQAGRELMRDSIESDLHLRGLILFRNELKPDSAAALKLLREGAVRTVMVSGDHPLTAIHIARQSGMIAEVGFHSFWVFQSRIVFLILI
jgi:magnesium-transporting ATPase (P-type)